MSITKVARLAGVSTSTVSRVVNNHPRVAPDTIKAVRRAMEQLNYTPSERRPGPKPMRRNHGASTIALLVFGTAQQEPTPAFAEMLRGVSQAAAQYELSLIYQHLPDVNQLPAFFADQRVDGLLLHGAMPGPAVRERIERLPTVWLMGNRQRPNWGDRVMPDFFELGEQAARHLLRRGHDHLAFINLDPGHWSLQLCSMAFRITAETADAQVELLEQPRDPGKGHWDPYNPTSAEQLAQRFTELDPRPTGVCVADVMQTALMQPALQRAGVRLAEGAGELITCNCEEPFLIGLHPRPMTFDVRAASIGQRGVEQLVWRLEHRNVSERITCVVEPCTRAV